MRTIERFRSLNVGHSWWLAGGRFCRPGSFCWPRQAGGRTRYSATVLLLALATALMLGATAAQHAIEIPNSPQRPDSGQAVNLLAPIKNMLSGRAWLLVEGIDPGLQRRPGTNLLTRMDWLGLQGGIAQPGAAMQAPGAAALVPFRNPGPAFSRDVLVTRDFSQVPIQTEPHLAANPRDPEHLVLGTIDYNFPSNSVYVSFDGGETWEGPNQVPYLPDDRVSGGDPVLAFGHDGTVHFASISIGVEEFAVGPVVIFSLVSSITVSNSADDGFTWPQPVSTARSRVTTEDLEPDQFGRLRGTIDVGFLDKPWLASGPHPEDPSRDVLYVTYTDFEASYDVFYVGELPALLPREVRTTIRLVTSDDNGITWSEPVAVSPTVRRGYGELEGGPGSGAFGTERVVQGSQPVVGPDGTVCAAWLDSTDDDSMKGVAEIWVSCSSDMGRSFEPPSVAASFNEIGFRPRNAFFRYWASAFPQLAIGPDGELYVVYVARPSDRLNDDGDVFVVGSRDRGESWTRPRRLNDDDGAALQFFPSVDVGPDGVVHVMWGDMRDDPAQTRYHIYYTRSENGGETWGFEDERLGFRVGDTRVTDFGSNPNRAFPNGLFIGDYFSISAAGDEVYMVWADARLGEFGGVNQKIGFSRLGAIASPEVFLSPPAGPGGQEVTLQGFGFQPQMDVFVLLGDATIAFARTNDKGRFTSQLFMPVTGEGAQTVRAVDASGNVASSSFFTEFGFGSIERLMRELGEQIEDLQQGPAADAGAPVLVSGPGGPPGPGPSTPGSGAIASSARSAGLWGPPTWVLLGALLVLTGLSLRRTLAGANRQHGPDRKE